ncbi:receptor-like protein EIX1 [Cornus florida]|uniref:receptor-like protein EIX1 n=1 Tax=Cornus florida TaxID=4283 RepID=UPI0028A08C5D|nr:receptor-like protein EIX1 [Cornus florida]
MVIMEYYRLSSLQVLVALYFIGYIMGGSLPNVQCMESEQKALLRFKESLVDHSDRLSSWVAEEEADCCKWRGVECNHTTGHVMALDLPNESLQGELNSALLDLPYLSYLDLSLNHFDTNEIPKFIGSLSNLEYLNLSQANFRGHIPRELGNLSRLHFLDLSSRYHPLTASNLDWLQGLSSLKVLNLGGVDLRNAVNWLNQINVLPSLVELHLFDSNLNKLPSSLPHANFTSLQILDLSLNNFSSSIPRWLFNISHSLVHINFTGSHLQGPIPDAFENMTSLAILDLSSNNLEGEIPKSLGLIREGNQLKGPSSLRELDLSYNQLNGKLLQSLGLLSKLVVLDVELNRLAGVITEAHFSNLSSLRVLRLDGNSFVLNMSSSWVPVFRLDIISLWDCHLGPLFPYWLRTQNDFSYISIDHAGISDSVPDWFWNLSTMADQVTLYSNQLKGKVPDLSSLVNLSHLDLGSNSFHGPLPRFSAKMKTLYLDDNLFSGHISHICESLVVNSSLSVLYLSGNNFSGQLPDCWTNGQNLDTLYLGNNQFYGKIPDSIGHLPLFILSLWGNRLYGEIPLSLKNCASLAHLNLKHNKLSGSIAWIEGSLPNLAILYLDSNNFSGTIPSHLCQLKHLKLLNLSSNHISGTIPLCINNIMGMTRTDYNPLTGEEDRNPMAPCSIDLSSNNLSGEIPIIVTSLIGLVYLNLSNNHLTGSIPHDIGSMKLLEQLDLSRNELSCSIPTSISDLASLEFLDASQNNLSGKIPSSMQKFDKASVMGNPNLCGLPTANDCLSNVTYEDALCRGEEASKGSESRQVENGDGIETTSFYIRMAAGFITGYCGFWSALLFNTSWRNAYYRFLGNLCEKIYVMVVVNMNRVSKKFQSKQA